MVHMFHNYDDDLDPEMSVEVETLQQRLAAVEDDLRKIGIYVVPEMTLAGFEQVPSLGTGGELVELQIKQFGSKGYVLIGQVFATIGDVAFSKRVQFPEEESIDDEFRVLEQSFANDEFLDQRNRIAQALEEGRDPFDES